MARPFSYQSVQWAFNPHRPLAQDMRVKHRGANVRVSQQFLNRADVVARLQKMGRETMAERMTARRPSDARLADGGLHRTLNAFLVNMVADGPSRVRVVAKRGCGKYVLPTPLRRVVRKFARQRIRQRHAGIPRLLLLIETKM